MGFKLTFCDVATGHLLDDDGTSKKDWQPVFETEKEALVQKDKILERFANAEVWIENSDTGLSQVFHNEPEKTQKFYDERDRYYRWWSLPWFIRIWKKPPKSEYFDPSKDSIDVNKHWRSKFGT